MRYGDYSFMSGYKAAVELLSPMNISNSVENEGGCRSEISNGNEKGRPDAIFAISDVMAAGVIKAAVEMGLKVPGDVSVAGFDDISMASMFIPSLTTISQPMYEMGRTAMELLLRQMRNLDKEISSKEASGKGVSENIVSGKDVSDKDVSGKEISENEISEKLVSGKDISDNDSKLIAY